MAFLLYVCGHGHPCLLSVGIFCHNTCRNEVYHLDVTADVMKGLSYVKMSSYTEGRHEVLFHCVFFCGNPETTETEFQNVTTVKLDSAKVFI